MSVRTVLLTLCACVSLASGVLGDAVSIHSMVSGGKVIELADTRQLTFREDGDVVGAWISPNGKHLAYQAEHSELGRMCIIDSKGGRSRVLMDSWQYAPIMENPKIGSEIWYVKARNAAGTFAAWSSDSRYIAFLIRHGMVKPLEDSEDEYEIDMQEFITVLSVNGNRRALFQIPKGYRITGNMLWNDGGTRFAAIFDNYNQNTSKYEHHILVFDLASGSIQDLSASEDDFIGCSILRWENGNKILYKTYNINKKVRLREITLDGSHGRVIIDDYGAGNKSPDGLFKLGPGISVENCATGAVVDIAKNDTARFIGWSPNSKFLSYSRHETLSDENKRRERDVSSVWLATPEAHKLNHMCLAVDSDRGWKQELSWSSDCMKIAYTCDGRAYVAELTSREPTPREKAEAGMPLTEEEVKELVVNQAKQIALAIYMNAQDYDDNLPNGDNLQEALLPYLKDGDMFYLPGTNKDIFTYFPLGNLGDIKDLATAVTGTMDAGYGWKVIVYADGHVETVAK